jgi:hypothetical protein
MRKDKEIQLVMEHPHLYLPAILESLGMSPAAAHKSEFGNRVLYKHEHFFDCGEGWLPILSAFAECLDQHLGMSDAADTANQPEEAPIALISGATTHHHRLYVRVETNRTADDAISGEIEALKAFARSLSGMYCEICGSLVFGNVAGDVRCTICKCRGL